ncbi:DUF3109 family protein [Mucilaginibacter sp.]
MSPRDPARTKSICSPACTFGDELQVRVHEFLKNPLIRKYGEEWYE